MRSRIYLLLALSIGAIIFRDGTFAQGSGPEVEPSTKVESLLLTSKIFGNTRTIRILLPPGYDQPDNSKRRYPVFYFNDGNTVFKTRSFTLKIGSYHLF